MCVCVHVCVHALILGKLLGNQRFKGHNIISQSIGGRGDHEEARVGRPVTANKIVTSS